MRRVILRAMRLWQSWLIVGIAVACLLAATSPPPGAAYGAVAGGAVSGGAPVITVDCDTDPDLCSG